MDFGKVKVQSIAILIGALIKLALNLILIPIPSIGLNGAAISTMVSQIIISFIIINTTMATLNLKLSAKQFLLKPFIAVGIMGISTVLSYKIIGLFVNREVIVTIISIGISMIVYGITCLILKIFSKEELQLVPILNKIM